MEEPPALSEIDELMWETMQAQDSVTISADIEQLAEAEDDMFGEMLAGDDTNMQLYGALDGSAIGMSFGDSDLVRVFGHEEAYLSGEAFFDLMGSAGAGLDGTDDDATSELFADTWIDFSSEISGEDNEFDLGGALGELQDGWNEGEANDDTPVARDELSDDGTHEVREEQDVWVYAGSEEGQELVLEANHDAPKIVALSDGDTTMTFSEWNATESPQRPEESQIIDQDEFEQRIMQAILGG